MTVTMDPEVEIAGQVNETREARLERLRAFKEQLERADQTADSGSLATAADLAAEYAEKEWLKERPPLTKKQYRGRPVEPDSISQFATWAQDAIGFAPRSTYYLLNAHELNRIICTRVQENRPTTAGPLRRLYKLIKEQRTEEAPVIWQRAVDEAGDVPSAEQVRKALAAHNKATGRTTTNRTAAYYQRTVKDEHKKLLRSLDFIHDHGGENAVRAVINDIQARLDQWEAEANATEPG